MRKNLLFFLSFLIISHFSFSQIPELYFFTRALSSEIIYLSPPWGYLSQFAFASEDAGDNANFSYINPSFGKNSLAWSFSLSAGKHSNEFEQKGLTFPIPSSFSLQLKLLPSLNLSFSIRNTWLSKLGYKDDEGVLKEEIDQTLRGAALFSGLRWERGNFALGIGIELFGENSRIYHKEISEIFSSPAVHGEENKTQEIEKNLTFKTTALRFKIGGIYSFSYKNYRISPFISYSSSGKFKGEVSGSIVKNGKEQELPSDYYPADFGSELSLGFLFKEDSVSLLLLYTKISKSSYYLKGERHLLFSISGGEKFPLTASISQSNLPDHLKTTSFSIGFQILKRGDSRLRISVFYSKMQAETSKVNEKIYSAYGISLSFLESKKKLNKSRKKKNYSVEDAIKDIFRRNIRR